VAVEHGLHDIDDVWRISTADAPIPYSPPLEEAFLPGSDAIVASVRARLGADKLIMTVTLTRHETTSRF
jgi:acetoin:2,6-dichlorophenolindophenol oxidoreductase subunit beta